jgi:MFS family permease
VRARRTHRALAGLLVIAPFALLLLSRLVWPDVPAVLPTHWTGPGEVDATTAGATYLGVVVSISGFCAMVGALTALFVSVVPDVWSRWIMTLLGAVAAGAASAYGITAWAVHLASGETDDVGPVWGLAFLLVAAGWGGLVYAVHGRRIPDRQEVLDRIPERDRVVPVTDPAPEAWQTQVRSRLLTGTSVFVLAVFVAVFVLVGMTDAWWAAVLLLVLGLALAAFVLAWSRIEVRADAEGWTVRSGVLPVRLRHVPAGEVVGVSRIDLDPMAWGGYGLRGLPGRTAYVVRGGPAVVVHDHVGHRLAIEIPEGEAVAEAGARVLRRSAGQALARQSPATP